MIALLPSIYITEINARPLRFFRATGSKPELPWHCLDELMAVCGFDCRQRRHFLRMTQADYGACIETVATLDGPVTIAPHFVAQGLIHAAVDIGRTPPATYQAYVRAGMEAMSAITKNLPAEMEIEYILAAARNNVGPGR